MENSSLNITSINVNSFNVSTLSAKYSKIYTKIEGVTSKKSDIIFLCDCRMGAKKAEIERMFRITRNGSYKLYSNSNKDSRGVAIAIRSDIFHEVENALLDRDENYIFLQISIKNKKYLLGCVYGPNKNDVGFFTKIREICEGQNREYIIGGDFNTVIDDRAGDLSLDRMGNGQCPNPKNLEYIQKWLREGRAKEPFRLIYPDRVEYSYISFRRVNNFGKNRLDFFMISDGLLQEVDNVVYEDRLGRDFDHREVNLKLGKKGGVRKERIFTDTIRNPLSKYVGMLATLDVLNEHRMVPCNNTRNIYVNLEEMVKRLENLRGNFGGTDREGRLVNKEMLDNHEREIDEFIEGNVSIETLYTVVGILHVILRTYMKYWSWQLKTG